MLLSTPAAAYSLPDWPPVLEWNHTLVQTSLYTRHFSPDPEHINQQDLISIELHNPQRWLAGTAWFKIRLINRHGTFMQVATFRFGNLDQT